MSYSSFKDGKLIFENFRKFVTEAADPSLVDPERFPTALSNVDAQKASSLVQMGSDELDQGNGDDVIDVDQNGVWAAKELKPSQTSMNLGKGAWFALGMLNGTMWDDKGSPTGGPGGKTGAFISSDKYLMDGHHRWIATAMADPSAPIKGFAVAFPGKQLVAILNAVTKGLLGVAKGKPGTGGFKQFKDRGAMIQTLTNLSQDKQPDGEGASFTGVAGATTPGKALEVIQEKTGKQGEEAMAAMADFFLSNLKTVPGADQSKVMPGAPKRVDMPVIDDKKATKGTPSIPNTIKALKTGQIDVNEPYGKIQKKAAE